LDTEGDPAVIDTTTNEANFPFLGSPVGDRIAFTQDGTLAYMVEDANTLTIGIEVATNREVALLDTDNGLATDVTITPDGRLVYVADRSHHLISVSGPEWPTSPPRTYSGGRTGPLSQIVPRPA